MNRVSRVLLSLGVVVASGWVCLPRGLAGPPPPLATENCDANGDGFRDLSDAVYILNWVFAGGPEPVPFDCLTPPTLDNGNCNGDPDRDLSDAVYLLNWVFTGGPAPVTVFCPGEEPTYVGSLTKTPGDWNYMATPGLAGAIAFCEQNFPGSSVCTIDQLLEAEAAGEFAAVLLDIEGNSVTSFWAHDADPGANLDQQCRASLTSDVVWTYATAHLAISGDFVDVDGATGQLSDIQRDETGRCNDIHWVPCCNQ